MKEAPGLYDYWPYEDRPKITWPDNARVAFWVAPNIEFYELEPAVNPHRAAWPKPSPDVSGYGTRDYGNRVGHMRMMRVLDKYGVEVIGQTDEIIERFYAISAERRIKYPAVSAITEAARRDLFA